MRVAGVASLVWTERSFYVSRLCCALTSVAWKPAPRALMVCSKPRSRSGKTTTSGRSVTASGCVDDFPVQGKVGFTSAATLVARSQRHAVAVWWRWRSRWWARFSCSSRNPVWMKRKKMTSSNFRQVPANSIFVRPCARSGCWPFRRLRSAVRIVWDSAQPAVPTVIRERATALHLSIPVGPDCAICATPTHNGFFCLERSG